MGGRGEWELEAMPNDNSQNCRKPTNAHCGQQLPIAVVVFHVLTSAAIRRKKQSSIIVTSVVRPHRFAKSNMIESMLTGSIPFRVATSRQMAAISL